MGKSLGWRMALLCFLAQNCGVGLTYGSYGAAVISLQNSLHTSRASVSLGIGLALLVVGLLSPIIGNMLQHVKARTILIAGAVSNSVGYFLLPHVNTVWELLLIFGVLIGAGTCMLGPLPTSTVVSRWFERDRGKALALTNTPAFMLLVPPIAVVLVQRGGTDLLFTVLAVCFLFLIPVLLFLVERPSEIASEACGDHVSPTANKSTAEKERANLSTLEILRDSRFWMLSFGAGVLTGSATVFSTHIIPVAVGKGITGAASSLPLSMYGTGTLAGAAIFGFLIDRYRAVPVFLLNAVLQVFLWTFLAVGNGLIALVTAGVFIGMCMGAVNALHSATLNEVFGPQNFSRTMGYSYFLKIPFLFGLVPLVGYIYDSTGNYYSALWFIAGSIMVSAVLLLLLARRVPAGAF